MDFLTAFLNNSILQMAVLAALGASLASGVMGAYVVVKRIVSLSGSIAHSVLSGLGFAIWLQRSVGVTWFSPLYGALLASILSALLIGWVHLRYREREDSVIAMIWTLGMAIGFLFAAYTPGYNVELMDFLLGNILWVSPHDLYWLFGLDAVILLMVFVLYNRFLALCFDEKQALLQGVRVKVLYLFLLVLISLTVVLLIYVVGIILALSMLALPAATAGSFTQRLSVVMGIATLLNIALSFAGLALSYTLDWPVGATIALLTGGVYLLSLRFKSKARFSNP